ncbi:hypothetical protein R3P38DRAFT_3358041 [Favolaschia claudopus]|uniref:Uncharacterized protein n=1 Tax=Favolaschia claudopus TaxID=2862362 RepID=A0AAW0B4L3_9AGAR
MASNSAALRRKIARKTSEAREKARKQQNYDARRHGLTTTKYFVHLPADGTLTRHTGGGFPRLAVLPVSADFGRPVKENSLCDQMTVDTRLFGRKSLVGWRTTSGNATDHWGSLLPLLSEPTPNGDEAVLER